MTCNTASAAPTPGTRTVTTCSRTLLLAALLAGLGIGAPAQAGAAKWSSTNVQYLYGTQYEPIFDNGDETRSIITLEHVNGWALGDNFFFVDITNPDHTGDETGTELYAELSPRLSLSKMTGSDLSYGIVQDVLITTTAEIGDAGTGFHNYLYGLAVDLKLPGFTFFQFNWYVRNEINARTDTGQQITLVWLVPFSIGPIDFAFEGFFDYAYDLDSDEAPTEDNIITGPRLLVDVGKAFGAPGTLQAGVEYQIWRNKFGIDGIDEDVPQAMLKWIW